MDASSISNASQVQQTSNVNSVNKNRQLNTTSSYQLKEDAEEASSIVYKYKSKKEAVEKDLLTKRKKLEEQVKKSIKTVQEHQEKDSGDNSKGSQQQQSKSFEEDAKNFLLSIDKNDNIDEKKIIAMASSFSMDPLTTSNLIKYVQEHSTKSNIKHAATESYKSFYIKNKQTIDASNNIEPVVKEFSELGGPKSLREVYTTNILSEKPPKAIAKNIITKFPSLKKQDEAVKFLLKSSSKDLVDRKIPPQKIKLIMSGIKNAESLITIKREFDKNSNFLKNSIKALKMTVDVPSTDLVYKRFVDLLVSGSFTSSKIRREVMLIAPKGNLYVAEQVVNLMKVILPLIPLSLFSPKFGSPEKILINNKNLLTNCLNQIQEEFNKEIEKESIKKANEDLKDIPSI